MATNPTKADPVVTESDIDYVQIRSVGRDRTGETHGDWEILGYSGALRWWAKCKCGHIGRIENKLLRHGKKSMSCKKCFLSAKRYASPDEKRLAGVFNGMKGRCYNKKELRYKDYGGRGISICDEWLMDIRRFIRWGIQSGYKYGLTIERMDNSGNYCPENCKWATHAEQSRNSRRNNMVGEGEDRACFEDYARSRNFNPRTLRARLVRGGSMEGSSTEPLVTIRKRNSNGTYAKEFV